MFNGSSFHFSEPAVKNDHPPKFVTVTGIWTSWHVADCREHPETEMDVGRQ
jgi:hypothetical protein